MILYLYLMKWIGSKYRMLVQILMMLIRTEEYYELFIGSGATFLNKEKSPLEVICDKDRGVATLWKVLGDSKKREEFKEKFLSMRVSGELFDLLVNVQKSGFPNMSDVDIAVITYYTTVFSFNGNRNDMCYRKKENEWERMEMQEKNRLQCNWKDLTKRISQAVVLNEDALDVLEKIKDRENAMIMLDPPYLQELLSDNKELYHVHFGIQEQVKMLTMIANCKAKVLLCGYRGGSYLYDRYLNKDNGWHCYIVHDRLLKACSTKEKKGYAEEYVWINYELPDKVRFFVDCTDWALTKEEAEKLGKSE